MFRLNEKEKKGKKNVRVYQGRAENTFVDQGFLVATLTPVVLGPPRPGQVESCPEVQTRAEWRGPPRWGPWWHPGEECVSGSVPGS